MILCWLICSSTGFRLLTMSECLRYRSCYFLRLCWRRNYLSLWRLIEVSRLLQLLWIWLSLMFCLIMLIDRVFTLLWAYQQLSMRSELAWRMRATLPRCIGRPREFLYWPMLWLGLQPCARVDLPSMHCLACWVSLDLMLDLEVLRNHYWSLALMSRLRCIGCRHVACPILIVVSSCRVRLGYLLFVWLFSAYGRVGFPSFRYANLRFLISSRDLRRHYR